MAQPLAEAETETESLISPLDELSFQDILSMNVKKLIAELELRGQVPSCKSKPALQLQLLAVTTGTPEGKVPKDEVDQDESGSDSEHEVLLSSNLKLKLKQLELQLESRKLDHPARIELRKLELAHELEKAHAKNTHEVVLAQAKSAPPAEIVTPPILTSAPPQFRVENAVKLIPRFDENDIETFLLSFERIARLNNFPTNKYAAILQAHVSGKALRVFTELC
jgi:hypothetical protein